MHTHTHTHAVIAAHATVLAAGLALITGCIDPKKPDAAPKVVAPAEEVVLAERLLTAGRLQDATIAAVDITRKNPQAHGLADLQYRIARKLAEERMANAMKRSEPTLNASTADAKRQGVMPDMYRVKKHVVGETEPLRAVPTAMQEMLQRTVSINLSNADISAIIRQIGETQGINMIADANVGAPDPDTGEPPTVSIYAEDTPLIEILEYIGRNLEVSFSVGNNLIWVTYQPRNQPDPAPAGPPMETRIYKLRKGMIGSELGKSVAGGTPFQGVQSSSRQGGQQQQQQQPQQQDAEVGLLDTIERFVPQPDGADFLFNEKAHVLIVKNTRENLAQVEEFIEALDIRPLQVLIEARFISTTLSDLRDLGIEWMLDDRRAPRNASMVPGLPPIWRDPTIAGSDAATMRDARYDYNQQVYDFLGQRRAFAADPSTHSGPDAFANTMQFTRHALTAAADPTGSSLAWQFVLGNTALQATLHALQETGNAKTIVVPRVTTLNNREASFRVGEDTTYFDDVNTSISSTSGYGGGNSRDSTFNYNRPSTVETGYSLIVTPSVGSDLATINLVLRPEISAIKEWTEYIISTTSYTDLSGATEQPKIRIPTLTRQYIETEVVIRSGETIVLGGLVNTLKQENTKGTPWLSRIPLLGYLFKTETKKEEYNNILIFVTATVISDIGEELIPLQEMERYGLEVPEGLTIPDVFLNPPPDPDGEDDGEGEGGGEGDGGGDGEPVPAPDAAPEEVPAPDAPAPDAVVAPAPEPAPAPAPEPAPAVVAPVALLADPAPAVAPPPAVPVAPPVAPVPLLQ
ncbi:MAG: type II and III secretion system protein [Kiritimatiellaeota bacterium]|nr:type II and III secretion system protein [Kiritimatiellota bacterium]